MIKTIASLIGGFIVGILIIWGWNVYISTSSSVDVVGESTAPENLAAVENTENSEAIASEDFATVNESSNIDVRDQLPGDVVRVASVTLELDGWVVVHEERNGFVGNALGAVRRDAGTYSNIEVPLLRGTIEKTRFWIVLYSDNGDQQFNLRDDFPIRDSANNPITKSFNTL